MSTAGLRYGLGTLLELFDRHTADLIINPGKAGPGGSVMGDAQKGHSWQFLRLGGVDQVLLASGQDIVNLDQLDLKLWMALACPARGLALDPKTLQYLDTNKDGRIRVEEVLEAIRWVKVSLNDPGCLLQGGNRVAIDNIKDPVLARTAKRLLASLGKTDAQAICLDDLSEGLQRFAALPFNGDGVITQDCAPTDQLRKTIEDIMATIGPVLDRSGRMGVDKAKVAAFFDQAKAICQWDAMADRDKSILPLGREGTALAYEAVRQVKATINDYFVRSRLASFDQKAADLMNPQPVQYAALLDKGLCLEEMARLPLARIEPRRALPLKKGLNPAWEPTIVRFVSDAVVPLLGPGHSDLTEDDWQRLQSMLAPYQAWQASRPQTQVGLLGIDRLKAIIASNAESQIMDLIDKDLALADEAARLSDLEKLLLFQRDLVRFLNNFVSFVDFYRHQDAIFQVGTLYMDGRACSLCVEVTDLTKHAALAVFSGAFLAYCDCTRIDGQRMTIAAVFSDGDYDNLMPGRNGIFYDRNGLEWDATITKIISNPISIRQAFWSPYKKLVRWIEQQIAKRAEVAQAGVSQRLETGVQAIPTQQKDRPIPTTRIDIGTLAAIGLVLSTVAGVVGMVFGTIMGLGLWMPLGLIAIILCISGPSMILAYVKIRRRNLGPLLDACGWAVNGWARINVPLGRVLTKVARLPEGAQRHLLDPFARKKRP